MAYTYGTSTIKKNNFDILIRRHDETTWGDGPVDTIIDCKATPVGTDLNDVFRDGSSTWVHTFVAWLEIGKGNEKPVMKNSAGQSLNLNTGDELIISENSEISFEDLNITADNYSVLRNLAADTNIDILYVNVPSDAGTALSYGASNIKLSVFLEITGNDFNKMMVTAKRESDIADDVIMPITITRTDT